MELLTWTPVIFTRHGFPRDEAGRPFLPGNAIKEAITSAVIYYYIKKDREIEAKVKAYLLKKGLKPDEVIERVKEIITDKYPVLNGLEVPERIDLSNGEVYEARAEVFDLKKWEDVEDFKVEVFKGTIELPISSPHLEKLKAAGHSYCEALARMEMSMLRDHPLVEQFYQPLLNDLKRWEIPLRVGMWTEVRFRGNLLFFWRIKEVREKLMDELKMDIRPRRVIYLPREKCTTGWCELKV
ncbi:hypothetical protein [Thermovibrio ammonificans]|jgi:hypothetical protein|uniref:Uncharacterized protein n=1 Tax=Thermovibrio ammonificans (strain DSM 15698 / JCM 12110 / HB-1) TaxID=648996 RepID=E8T682_THEA1|nr:hypothetical protein [Thermovibrio ammonificans]ADU96666.1 hypothetical protein Theam_0698 [Thermovibrio ammonificans HB-1]